MSTSTGRIMQEIGDLAMQHGWESYIAYSKGRDGVKPCTSKLLPVGDKWSVALHGVMTRLFDRHGLASVGATKILFNKSLIFSRILFISIIFMDIFWIIRFF